MKRLRKILGCILAGMMLVLAVPPLIPELSAVTEVQAAPKVATPQLVSAVPYGKTKITVKWKPVKGVNGYRIYRRTNGSKWQAIRNVSGRYTSYADTKVNSGNEYTYTVRAYKRSGGKVYWSKYVIKGVKTIAGLKHLKINTFRKTIYTGSTYDLKILGTKLKPVWSTDNYRIAGVYRNGCVLAKRPGKARITGQLGGRKFTCDVVVKNKPAPDRRVAQNYEKLFSYMKKKGLKDSEGNYTLVGYTSDYFMTGMKYIPKQDILYMSSYQIVRDKKARDTAKSEAVNLWMNCAKNNRIRVVWKQKFSDGTLLEAETVLYAPNYRGEENLSFKYKNGKIMDPKKSKDVNQTLQKLLKLNGSFIKDKTGLSLKDLGFKAYKY